jgi:hypothetical protein
LYIIFNRPIHHWNYFLAIEDDLINTSRYVEITLDNKETYSVEYTKIILSAASEVDVLLKQIYLSLGFKKKNPNFKDYCNVAKDKLKSLITEQLCLEQYGLTLEPFSEWENDEQPSWHIAYNNLKHNRTLNYKEANLENALLSVGALYTTVVHYYLYTTPLKISIEERHLLDFTQSLSPKPKLIHFTRFL